MSSKSPFQNFWITAGTLFLVLHLISAAVQLLFPHSNKSGAHIQKNEVLYNQERVVLQYHKYGDNDTNIPLIIYPDLYGNRSIHLLAEKLADERTIIIPIYPEHAANGKRISHSMQSRAELIRKLMIESGYDSWHGAGYGYGGIVMASGYQISGNERIKSLIFIQSPVLQEFRFLGNHTLNRSLHSLLYPLHGFIKYAVPHSGWYHHQPVNEQFIQSLMQLDQRNIRDSLIKIEQPVLIANTDHDQHSLLAAADELYRILPQSNKIVIKSYQEEQRKVFDWEPAIRDFITQAEMGNLADRPTAATERIEQSEKPFDSTTRKPAEGVTLFILIIILATITLISEDLACIGGGLAVASGIMGFWFAVLGCFMGILLADIAVYWMGRRIGRPLLRWFPFRWFIKEKDIIWAENMFENNALQIIFASRFLPGTRFPTYFSAGMVKAHFGMFVLYFTLAISLWTPFFVGISTLLGQQLLGYLMIYQDHALLITIALVILIYSMFKLLMPLATAKGRKEFAVKVIRFKQKLIGI